MQGEAAEILTVSSTSTPTDWYPSSVFYIELERNYGLVPQFSTGLPTDW